MCLQKVIIIISGIFKNTFIFFHMTLLLTLAFFLQRQCHCRFYLQLWHVVLWETEFLLQFSGHFSRVFWCVTKTGGLFEYTVSMISSYLDWLSWIFFSEVCSPQLSIWRLDQLLRGPRSRIGWVRLQCLLHLQKKWFNIGLILILFRLIWSFWGHFGLSWS